MSRPRTIKLPQGEVSLQGFPKDVADALSEHIKSFGQPSGVTIPPAAIPAAELPNFRPLSIEPAPEADVSNLPSKAIGLYKEGNVKKIVTVAYNLSSGVARVESEELCDGMREAIMKFKMAADKNGFV